MNLKNKEARVIEPSGLEFLVDKSPVNVPTGKVRCHA
jgi:hypothetical protein